MEGQKYNDHDIWVDLINHFVPPEGYARDSYYGPGMIPLKRNGEYQIKLFYDYKKNNITSLNSFRAETFDEAMDILKILNNHRKNKNDKDKEKDSAASIRDKMRKRQ